MAGLLQTEALAGFHVERGKALSCAFFVGPELEQL